MSAADFDFLHGTWQVAHRRLKERLAGSTEWQDFGGSMRCAPILGGSGSFDENVIDLPGGAYQACTLRLFRADTASWTIRWIDGRNPELDPPMIGSFADAVGTFLGDDSFAGRAIRVRFLWSRITADSARWEQAFSTPDNDWETNWIMDFDRA